MRKNLIHRALGKTDDEFTGLSVAQDSAFPVRMPNGGDPLPIKTESSPESDAFSGDDRTAHPLVLLASSHAESIPVSEAEDDAFRELDAKLNSPPPPEGGPDVDTLEPRVEQWSVTVDGDPMAWYLFCDTYRAHPLYIEGVDLTRRLVAIMDYDPTVKQEGQSFVDMAASNGFPVIRVRHLVSRVEDGETALYYEAVVSLDGSMRTDRTGSSRNLYTRDRWYRVKRCAGPFDEALWLQFATTTSKPSKAIAVTYGAIVLDTNSALDAGWSL
jgi:hypothetical protein